MDTGTRSGPPSARELLARLRRALEPVYGDRLKGLVLYGSEARGEATPESDIDVLVLIDGPVRLWDDIVRIVKATFPFQLEVSRPVHCSPVDAADFDAGEFLLYRNAKKDGIRG